MPNTVSQAYNVYCDESCHLEHDGQKVMVQGALWCPVEKTREIAMRLREKKAAFGLKAGFEIKWTKVSPAKLGFYTDIVDYFFDDDHLLFRALIAEKTHLNHGTFPGQDHDQWYYKMLFTLLSPILNPEAQYNIYLDLKDTQSSTKASKLREVLCNARYDFDRHLINRIQPVRSDEVEQLQLCDLLIGAVCHINRELTGSTAKTALIERIKKRSNYSLIRSTLLREKKFNVFRWQAQDTLS
jgi:hypothetical protein